MGAQLPAPIWAPATAPCPSQLGRGLPVCQLYEIRIRSRPLSQMLKVR